MMRNSLRITVFQISQIKKLCSTTKVLSCLGKKLDPGSFSLGSDGHLKTGVSDRAQRGYFKVDTLSRVTSDPVLGEIHHCEVFPVRIPSNQDFTVLFEMYQKISRY